MKQGDRWGGNVNHKNLTVKIEIYGLHYYPSNPSCFMAFFYSTS